MKSRSHWMILASLLSTGGSAWAHQITLDAGYHGSFQQFTVDADTDDNDTADTLAEALSPDAVKANYIFKGWEPAPASFDGAITLKAIYETEVAITGTRNLISLGLTPTSLYASVLENFVPAGSQNFVQDAKGKYIRNVDNTLVNNITTPDGLQGYQLYSPTAIAAESATFEGTTFQAGTSIQLSEGYNYVPFLLTETALYEDYFSSILGSIESVKDSNGDTITTGSSLNAGEAYLVKMTAPTTFTIPFDAPVPDSPATAPVDGEEIIVTVGNDHTTNETLTTVYTQEASQANWDNIIEDGVTLREAIWFAEQLSGNSSESITFHSSLSGTEVKVKNEHISIASNEAEADEVVVELGFSINGDLDGNNTADITITPANTITQHSFIRTATQTFGLMTLNGIIFKNFDNTPNGGAIMYTHQTSATVTNCTFEDISAGWGSVMQASNGTLEISWTKFINCDITGASGVLMSKSGGSFTMENCYIEGCESTHSNAAGYILDVGNNGAMSISNTMFVNCGGTDDQPEIAFKAHSSWNNNITKLTVTDSTFINNNFSAFSYPEVNPDIVATGTATNTATIEYDNISEYGTTDGSNSNAEVDIIAFEDNTNTNANGDAYHVVRITDLDSNSETIDTTNTGTTPLSYKGITFVDTGSNVGAYAGVLASNSIPTVNPEISTLLIHKSDKTTESTFDVSALFIDANNDEITVTGPTYDGVEPGEISYNEETGEFTVVPGIPAGDYEYTFSASDWTGEVVTAVVIISVPAVIEVTDAGWEDTLATFDSENDTIAEAVGKLSSADGITLNEAITIANAYEGTQIITFNDSVTECAISNQLTIEDDLVIEGNGAKLTSLQIAGTDAHLTVLNNQAAPINVAISNLTFSGSTGNVDTTDDTSDEALLEIVGQQDTTDTTNSTAHFASVSLDSVEFVNHTIENVLRGAITAVFANMNISNIYFGNIHSNKSAAVYAEHSSYTIDGMTVDNCSAKIGGGYRYMLFTEHRDSKSKITSKMSATFREQVSVSVTNSTFNNCELSNNTNCRLIGITTDDASENLDVSNLTVAASPAQSHGYLRSSTIVGGVESATALAAPNGNVSELPTRNGVRFYEDDTVESGIFADTGADEMTGYTVD